MGIPRMPTIKELKEQRAQALSEVRALEEKYSGAALPDEAKPAWERFAAECESLEAQITAAEDELKRPRIKRSCLEWTKRIQPR